MKKLLAVVLAVVIMLSLCSCAFGKAVTAYSLYLKAVKTIDSLVKEVVDCAKENGYSVLITADHGNADNAVNADGSPNTAHSLNPVPFIVVDNDIKEVKDGILADIAPTVLKMMGIEQPAAMTGTPLV